jgi:ribosomal protein S12 methylthiotransferase accessory factor
MIHRPVFKQHFHIEPVPNEGIFLLSEQGHHVLTGHLNEIVVPVIDGELTADEITDHLKGQASIAEVYYALALLEKNGHLTEGNDDLTVPEAAFWTALDADPRTVRRKLAATRVHLKSFGAEADATMTRTLETFGISTADQGGISLVLANDYMRPEFEALNAEHLANGKPWMLIKPVGLVLWIGPLFVPGKTGCWQCLAQRLRGNREVESFLERKGRRGPFPVSRAQIPASIEQALQIAALQLAIFLVKGENPKLEGQVVTMNVLNLQTETHQLIRRPQCPVCGHPDKYLNTGHMIELQGTEKTYIQDGGRRRTTPEATYKHFAHHVSPITGVVSSLLPTMDVESSPLRVYIAGHNFALKNDSLYFLRESLRSKSCGKGATEAQARASALCEAIERYSGLYRGEETTIRASFQALDGQAIHPNACMLFSEQQYRDRLAWLARGSRFQVVPMPFQENVEIDWTPVYSLTQQMLKFLPTGYLYYGYPMRDDQFYFWADSNGNAAGNTLDEAFVQGFLELVERDSVCLWWYNQVRRPAVALASLKDSYIDSLLDYYARMGREFWVLDLTSDTGIPTFVSICRRVDEPPEEIVFGFGSHLDPHVAIMRAVTEMNQFMPAVLSRQLSGGTEYGYDDPDCVNWWKTATLATQPCLQPLPATTRLISDFPNLSGKSLVEDVRTCISIAQQLGMETLALNQTRPDIGLNVAKVIVPGMRHFWARFAPGRLYDVPVRMGWVAEPTPESNLNPIAMFV